MKSTPILTPLRKIVLGVALALSVAGPSMAQETAVATTEPKASAADLAKATQNPISSLISLPLQNNADWGAGHAGDGFQYKFTVQPVIPVSLDDDWNLISRTIVPYIYQEDVFGTSSQSGLSDTVQSLFFSPKDPTASGWIWGAGPVFQIPTATDDLLGEEKWGAGPAGVFLKQEGSWTYGGLFNHVWSFAGEDARDGVNRTYFQPFLSYTSPSSTSFGLNIESTYDWERSQWSVPINATIQQILTVGGQPLSLQLGGRYYAEGPSGGPEWGLRFQVSLLFPK